MRYDQIKAGDQVQLLSGGPIMTVSLVQATYDYENREGIHCQWFAGKKLEEAVFNPETLRTAPTEDSKKKS